MTAIPATTLTIRRKAPRWIRRIPFYILVVLFCFVTAFPIYWMIASVIQPVNNILEYPPPLIPRDLTLQPFSEIFKVEDNLDRVDIWIENSILLASMTTVICLVLTVLGAYAMSGMRWRGKGLFGLLLLMTQMLPEALLIIPVYATVDKLQMKNNLLVLALIYTAFILPICIWVLKNVFDTIPHEIRQAGMVDGCTRIGVLWRIMLPIAAPGLVAVAVVAFFYSWNEYLFAASLVTDKHYFTAPMGLAGLISMIGFPIDKMLAGGLVFAIFPVIFYLMVQRYVVAGLSAGAVKG
jgi:multiple sugar transport system permease protein